MLEEENNFSEKEQEQIDNIELWDSNNTALPDKEIQSIDLIPTDAYFCIEEDEIEDNYCIDIEMNLKIPDTFDSTVVGIGEPKVTKSSLEKYLLDDVIVECNKGIGWYAKPISEGHLDKETLINYLSSIKNIGTWDQYLPDQGVIDRCLETLVGT